MEDARKLKRGLRDISPLFTEVYHPTSLPPPTEISKKIFIKNEDKPCLQLFSVFHPRYQKNSQVLDFWMAGRMMRAGYFASVLSITAENMDKSKQSQAVFRSDVPHKTLSAADFDLICASAAKQPELAQHATIFLNFSWLHVPFFRRVLPVVDKTIFWINADLEMMTETYRQLKWMSKLNTKMEFCIAFDGTSAIKDESVVFERFSEMVSRNLGLALTWLGGSEVLASDSAEAEKDLAWDVLASKSGASLALSEKNKLADYMMAAS